MTRMVPPALPNGSRLSCGALKKASFLSLRRRQLQALVRRHPPQRTLHALSVCTRLVMRHRSLTCMTAIPSSTRNPRIRHGDDPYSHRVALEPEHPGAKGISFGQGVDSCLCGARTVAGWQRPASTRARALPRPDPKGTCEQKQKNEGEERDSSHAQVPPNGSRLSCGALKKNSFPNLCAPPASSAC